MMKITLTPQAYWHLQWMAHRTPCEVSSMGLLAPARDGLLIEDFILVRQTVSTATVDLDMNWWAEKQVQLYDREGIEPWRTSCWTHTHPAGINCPSGTDEQTMARSFGSWDFALMLILTKAGVFYARMDFDHPFGPGCKTRLETRCSVHVDWAIAGVNPVDQETLAVWESEFRELVREERRSPFTRGLPNARYPAIAGTGRPSGLKADDLNPQEKEIEDYVWLLESAGLDPRDADDFDPSFGRGADLHF
jgi:hypothetical protein